MSQHMVASVFLILRNTVTQQLGLKDPLSLEGRRKKGLPLYTTRPMEKSKSIQFHLVRAEVPDPNFSCLQQKKESSRGELDVLIAPVHLGGMSDPALHLQNLPSIPLVGSEPTLGNNPQLQMVQRGNPIGSRQRREQGERD
ncbi:hypothetical protein B0H14DRAFT_2588489 [Mycena olivaceomarginata]|nr:hypothetical protein B0H14DRAFT_2588489 [Mycena olivaceomarginata]